MEWTKRPTYQKDRSAIILTDCGFIFPVIKASKSESAIVIVQSAFLSEPEIGRRTKEKRDRFSFTYTFSSTATDCTRITSSASAV